MGTVSLGGLGVGCRCQNVPFHLSANVTLTPEVLRLVPTAVQALAAEHDTALSCPPGTVALGDFRIFHAGWMRSGAPTRTASAGPAGATTATAVSAHAARPATKPPQAFLPPHPRMAAPPDSASTQSAQRPCPEGDPLRDPPQLGVLGTPERAQQCRTVQVA